MTGADPTTISVPQTHRLVYLVHDLGDPAVARRLAMLEPYLESAVVIGFHRTAEVPDRVAGWPAVAIGRTHDGRLGRRLLSVAAARFAAGRLRNYFLNSTVVIARQLEMLLLARALRAKFAANATLVYECLDIHRLMTASSPIAAILQPLEARFLRDTDLLVVSSPAFVSQHLARIHGSVLPPVFIAENKVLAAEAGFDQQNWDRPAGPPWRIGWYGVLRCRRSLELLAELVRRLPGRVVVELRGRPALSAIPDFAALVAAAPGLEFLGPYDRHRDLGRIYGGVHFAWAIDFFEDGGNSQWLLPNRLYEGGAHGAIPIAMDSVETGRWLARHAAGIRLGEAAGDDLFSYFFTLTEAAYMAARQSLAAVPRENWVDDGQDGAALAAMLACRSRRQYRTG